MNPGGDIAGCLPGIEERRALIDRILASRPFENAVRLRDLLRYLAERSEGEDAVREDQIGVAVFGRPAGYDTSHDTLVRVQISHLRKRLQQYFEDDGRNEVWEIMIPKGNYTLSFHALNPEVGLDLAPSPAPVEVQTVALVEPRRRLASRRVAALALVALAVIAAAAWMVRHRDAGAESESATLWRDLFGNGQSTYVVLADANLIEFENVIRHQFTPSEYDGKDFESFAMERIKDPEVRRLVLKALQRPMTSVVDAQAAQRIGLWAAQAGAKVEVVGARDMSLRHIAAQNTILLGSRRANPWVNVFENRLNFQTVFEEGTPPRAWFTNRSPRPGEQPEYHQEWSALGYCRVAYLPNPKASGATLLLSGTDLYSSEGGVDFITGEARVRDLRAKLGLRDGEKMPPFEVLLRTREAASAAPEFDVVAWRRY